MHGRHTEPQLDPEFCMASVIQLWFPVAGPSVRAPRKLGGPGKMDLKDLQPLSGPLSRTVCVRVQAWGHELKT